MSILSTSIQHHARGSGQENFKKEKERKTSWLEMEDVKLSLFADDTLLYIENPKEFTKHVLETTKEFSRIEG